MIKRRSMASAKRWRVDVFGATRPLSRRAIAVWVVPIRFANSICVTPALVRASAIARAISLLKSLCLGWVRAIIAYTLYSIHVIIALMQYSIYAIVDKLAH